MLNVRRLLIGAVLAAALLPAAALAAPDRTVTFSASSLAAAWEGSGAFGATPGGVYECKVGGFYNCDDTLIDLKDAGGVKFSGTTDGNFIMSADLFKATADGAPDGDPLAEGELGADFSVAMKGLEPGKYLLRIVFRLAANASFTAKASFTPAAPPAAPAPVVAVAAPAAPAPAAPAAAPAKAKAKAKPSCKAKAKKIKNAKKRKAALKRCAKAKKKK
jgi:hypothetical protein